MLECDYYEGPDDFMRQGVVEDASMTLPMTHQEPRSKGKGGTLVGKVAQPTHEVRRGSWAEWHDRDRAQRLRQGSDLFASDRHRKPEELERCHACEWAGVPARSQLCPSCGARDCLSASEDSMRVGVRENGKAASLPVQVLGYR